MATFECLTHNIKVTITPTERTFETPPGSYGHLPQCKLLTIKNPQPGKVHKCEIREVK